MSQDKNLKEYTVKITQTLEGFVTILAESREDAFKEAHQTYVTEGHELPDMEDNYPLKINVVEEKEIVPEVIKNNEPIYLVSYDNKGLSETNFISTKADLMKDIGIDEDFFNSFDGDVIQNTYAVAANKTYEIWLCKSVKQLANFLNGNCNTDIQELIWNNFDEGEYDGSYDDWYWCNEPEWCSKEAMDIAKLYALSTDDIELQKSILMGLNLIGVERLWGSVTQGEAAVMIDGKKVVQYGDAMWLQSRDKSKYVNGFNEKSAEEVKFFKENAGGWGSIKSDDVFIKAALEQFPEKVKDALMETIDKKTLAKNNLINEQDKKSLDSIVENAESKKKLNKSSTKEKLDIEQSK